MPAMGFARATLDPGCLAPQPTQPNEVNKAPVEAWVDLNGGRPTARVLSPKVQGEIKRYVEFETGFAMAAEKERTR